MRKKIAMAGLLGVLCGPSHAALPPQYQRVAEFKAIFDDASVAAAFPRGQAIERVEYVSPDLYRVTAGRCVLDVTIQDKPLPNGMVGPRQFDLKIGPVDCPAG